MSAGQSAGPAQPSRLASHIVAFGQALRGAGVPVDASRIATALEAAALVNLGDSLQFEVALESVLISREQDRAVFRELFEAWFRSPRSMPLLQEATALPRPQGSRGRRARVLDALAPPRTRQPGAAPPGSDRDAGTSASAVQRLRHADFASLGADEYRRVERLAREIPLPLPQVRSRRSRPAARGERMHWAQALRIARRTGGELMVLPHHRPRPEPLPLLVLLDVSGSMERYARMLLAFLHAATAGRPGRRDVFAIGTVLSDLTPAFRLRDTDAMLAAASAAIPDYAGGTRLGDALAELRLRHARRLLGGRTVVLVVSDGLDTGDPARFTRELGWLRLHSRRLLWLNPLLRFQGYQPLARGAAVLHRHVHGMLAVHDLSRLEQLAAGLAGVMKR